MGHPSQDTLDALGFEYGGARFVVASSPADVEACRDLTFERVAHADYGCEDIEAYRAAFADTSRHTYLIARSVDDGSLMGTYRLQSPYRLSEHADLDDSSSTLELDRLVADPWRVADVASFIVASHDPRPAIARAASTSRFGVAWLALFRLSVHYCHETGIDALYIQARPEHARLYGSVGFHTIGPRFAAPGWSGEWTPMLIRLDQVRAGYLDPEFARRLAGHTGRSFRSFFWHCMVTDELPEGLPGLA